MKEYDILGGSKSYSDPSYIFSGGQDSPTPMMYVPGRYIAILKVKVHTLDTAPLRSETPPQKRSGTARVLKGSHSNFYLHTNILLSDIGYVYKYFRERLDTVQRYVNSYRAVCVLIQYMNVSVCTVVGRLCLCGGSR